MRVFFFGADCCAWMGECVCIRLYVFPTWVPRTHDVCGKVVAVDPGAFTVGREWKTCDVGGNTSDVCDLTDDNFLVLLSLL